MCTFIFCSNKKSHPQTKLFCQLVTIFIVSVYLFIVFTKLCVFAGEYLAGGNQLSHRKVQEQLRKLINFRLLRGNWNKIYPLMDF